MYTEYWKLREHPFRNAMSDKFIHLTAQHQEGLARLYYLVDHYRIAGMLTGDFGTGKTMTLECVARRAKDIGLEVIMIDAVPNGALPIARHILRSLGIDDPAATLPEALMSLQVHARDPQLSTKLKHSVLLIDEAQHLASDDGLYLVHYLCNLRIPGTTSNGGENAAGDNELLPLFTIILAGTQALREAVNGYESLRRRIQLDWNISAFDHEQTVSYVQHHLRVAGGDIWCFTADALEAVYEYSGGVPRSINNLCDTALMLGFAAHLSAVTREVVDQAALDTGIGGYYNMQDAENRRS